jgi:AAA family ATP:ADP antiporter
LVFWTSLSVIQNKMPAQWVIFLMPAWFQITANLGILAVWPLAGRLFDVRQARRVFGLIGGGNWIATILAGVLVTPIIVKIGVVNLVLVASVSFILAVGCLWIILRIHSLQTQDQESTQISHFQKPTPILKLAKNSYILFILGMIVFWWIGFFVIDNIFYDRAASQFSDLNQLASFIGRLVSTQGILALITTTFITSRLINKFGLRTARLILPIILVGITSAIFISGSLRGEIALLFWLASLAKLVNVALGFSLDQTTLIIFYQPLSVNERGRMQTLAEGIVAPIAIGIAGFLLLIFNTWLEFNAIQLSVVFLVIAVGWIGSVFGLTRLYPAACAKALEKHRMVKSSVPVLDPTTHQILEDSLCSLQPGAVLYALNLLEGYNEASFSNSLIELTNHESPEVRMIAFRRIAESHDNKAILSVLDQYEREKVDEVRAEALRTMEILDPEKAYPLAKSAVLENSFDLRKSALVILMHHAHSMQAIGLDSNTILDDSIQFEQMAASPDPLEREIAAVAIGEGGLPSYYRELKRFLLDDSPVVRCAAISSAGKIHDPSYWGLIVDALTDPLTRRTARWSLIQGGDSVIKALQDGFANKNYPVNTICDFFYIAGRIGSISSTDWLKIYLDYPDAKARTCLLRALSKNDKSENWITDNEIHQHIFLEVKQAVELMAVLDDLGNEESTGLLFSSLENSLLKTKERIFLFLSLMHNYDEIMNSWTALQSNNSQQKAYAIEVLDNRLSPNLRQTIIPLIDDSALSAKLDTLSKIFSPKRLGCSERLQNIMQSTGYMYDDWSKECAAFAYSRLFMPEKANKGETKMLSLVEKVLILKGVPIFSNTPDEVLVDVASILKEVSYCEGECIITKGKYGDSLYIIASGSVRVHDEDLTHKVLMQAEEFGELSLLDPGPRVASVTALEDTSLLQLTHEPFHEIMDDRLEIAQGVIKALTGYLRERVINKQD